MENEKQHKRTIFSWVMYDWGNSAFATTIMAAVLPIYYSSLVTKDAGLPENIGTAYWGYTTSIAMLIIAILSPILGAIADFQGSKKKMLTIFMLIGVTGTALLYLVGIGEFLHEKNYLAASIFFIIGNIGFAGSLVFYDSLLPHITRPDEVDQVSTRGYAMGYLGGGLLLAINLGMIMAIPKLFQDESLTALMTRLSFVTVAIWWFVFTIPLLRNIHEPPRRILSGEEKFNPLQASFSRLRQTFREIRQYRDLFLFLIAFWLYANGIGTIISMAAIYGTELKIDSTWLIGTLLMVQFVGIPFSFLFGWLARRIGTKQSIYISLAIYTCIAIAGSFVQVGWHFLALGAAVATVQGGSQALSRSLISRLMPKSKSAEFYGFFSVTEKFSSIAGPFIFGVVSQLMGSSRLAIVSLIIFFVLGAFVLTQVNVKKGIETADFEEAKLLQIAL